MKIEHTNASKWLISCLFWISCLEQESTYRDEAKEESVRLPLFPVHPMTNPKRAKGTVGCTCSPGSIPFRCTSCLPTPHPPPLCSTSLLLTQFKHFPIGTQFTFSLRVRSSINSHSSYWATTNDRIDRTKSRFRIQYRRIVEGIVSGNGWVVLSMITGT